MNADWDSWLCIALHWNSGIWGGSHGEVNIGSSGSSSKKLRGKSIYSSIQHSIDATTLTIALSRLIHTLSPFSSHIQYPLSASKRVLLQNQLEPVLQSAQVKN